MVVTGDPGSASVSLMYAQWTWGPQGLGLWPHLVSRFLQPAALSLLLTLNTQALISDDILRVLTILIADPAFFFFFFLSLFPICENDLGPTAGVLDQVHLPLGLPSWAFPSLPTCFLKTLEYGTEFQRTHGWILGDVP